MLRIQRIHSHTRTTLLGLFLLFTLTKGYSAPISTHFTTVRLKIAGKYISDTIPVRSSGTETYVGVGVLKYVGATAKTTRMGDSVLISTPSNGQTTEVGFARIEGQSLLPLSEVVRLVKGTVARGYDKADTADTYDRETVYLLAKVTRIQVRTDGLRLETGFPVPYKVRNVNEPGQYRGYVDCIGAALSDTVIPQVNPDMSQTVRRVRTGQNEKDVARIVVEFRDRQGLAIADALDNDNRRIVASLTNSLRDTRDTIATRDNTSLQKPTRIGSSPQEYELDREDTTGSRTRPIETANRAGGRGSLGSRAGGVRREPIVLQSITATLEPNDHIRLEMVLTGAVQPVIRYARDRGQLFIDLPDTTLSLEQTGQALQDLQYPAVKKLMAYLLEDSLSTTRIALDAPRNIKFRSRTLDNVLRIDLKIPEQRTGVLAGKTVVVDAGHGGTDTGAHGGRGVAVYEKNLTLAFALKLRTALEAMGAEVVMTRDSDATVALYDRPALANSIGADLFVSIHNDSSPRENGASGTSTYYHAEDSVSHKLAQAVQTAITAVSGLPSRKTISDFNRFRNGMAVLRMSKMPAILVEVAYINNDTDRKKLMSLDFQQTIADAIAQGISNYITGANEDWNNEERRNRTPDPDKEMPKETPKEEPDES